MADFITYGICAFILTVALLLAGFPLYRLRKNNLRFQFPLISRILLVFASLPGLASLNFMLFSPSIVQTRDYYRNLVFYGLLLVLPATLLVMIHAWVSLRVKENLITGWAGFGWSILSIVVATLLLAGLFVTLLFGGLFSSGSSLFT